MSYTITRTKVLRPRRARDTLSRPRLLGMLDDLLEYKLALVSAPAGFGKTTLLVDYADQAAYPVCWLALDVLDNDLLRFISYLIAAVQEHFPTFGGASRSLISNLGGGEIDRDRITRTIINDLYDNVQEHFALIIDDFHLVEDHPDISDFVNHFAQEVDENCHLVIASRSLLSLPDLPLMIGRSQVKGLSFEELAFEPEEIQALYQTKYNQELSQREAEGIAQDTEGWITGLLLTAETTRGKRTDHGDAARAAGINVYDYLASQVLDQQSPVMQDFMLRSSLLEGFNAALCQETLGEPPAGRSWSDLIGELLQKNLFIQPVEDSGTWLRYHHLFGDFLRQRCQETDPDGARELLETLVAVYTERGWWEKAYAACQQLNNEKITADFLERASTPLAHSGRHKLLGSWLEQLNPDQLSKRSLLLAQHAGILITHGKPQYALQLLDQALEGTSSNGATSSLGVLLLRRATSHRLLGNYSDGLRDARAAFELASSKKHDKTLIAESEREISLILRRLGNTIEAKSHLESSQKIYLEEKDQKNAAIVEMDLGFIEMSAGNYGDARRYYQYAYTIWENIGNHNLLGGLCNNLGVLDHLLGDYQEAFNWFSEGLEYARQTSNTRGAAFNLTSLADLARDMEALYFASSYLEEAVHHANESNETYLQIYLKVLRADLARKNSHIEEAKSHLDGAQIVILNNPTGIEAGFYHFEWGRIWLAENQLELARGEFEAAQEIFSKAKSPVEAAAALIFQARVEQLENKNVRAQELLLDAGQILERLGTITPLVPLLAGDKDLLPGLILLFPPDSYLQALNRAVADFQIRLPQIQAALGFHQSPISAYLIPTLDIQGLGHEQVRREGEAIEVPEWTKQKTVRELFFYLLSQPEGATREEICKVFWPDSGTEQLNKQFKNALYRLRRSVGKEAILYHQPTRLYLFNRDLDYQYDVEEYRLAADRAENETDPERVIHSLRQAADRYSHPFAPTLEGIWAEPERFRLFTLFESTILALAELLLDRGDHRGALNACFRLLDLSPGQEQACRLAMRALAVRGDRMGIERVFQACRQALARELESEPSPETTKLYTKLLG